MKLGKWKIELIVVVLLVTIGLGVWWFVSTKDERIASSEIESMIKYAQRQALEIAIIEQSSKLADYRRRLAAAKQPVTNKTIPNVLMPAPVLPAPTIADPTE